MSPPISIRLERNTRITLEEAARERGIGLSSDLRELATQEARRVRRERIRAQSRGVGDYVAATPEAAAFFDDWGTPGGDTERQ
jgi:hypothetical protein